MAIQEVRCIAYTRVSTEEQAEEGVSLEAQRRSIESFVASQPGYTLVSVYVEAAKSGKNKDRPQLQKLRDDAKLDKFDLLLFTKVDRMSRSVRDIYDLYEELEKSNVALIAVQQPDINTSTPTGRLAFGILAVFAQYEREQIVDRTVKALAMLKSDGSLFSGPCPYGLEKKADRRGYVWRSDAYKSAVVSVFDSATAGTPERQIARIFDITRDTVRGILRCTAYAGQKSYETRNAANARTDWTSWSMHPIDLEPVITLERWKEVQSLVRSRNKSGMGTTSPLFGKLLRADGDHIMTAHGNQGPHHRTRYSNDSDKRDGTGHSYRVWEDEIQGPILQLMADAVKDLSLPAGDTHPRQGLIDKMSGVQKRIENLNDNLYEGKDLDIEKLKDRLTLAEEEKTRLEERMEELVVRDELKANAAVALANWKQFYWSLDRSGQRVVMQRFIKMMRVNENQISIEWTFGGSSRFLMHKGHPLQLVKTPTTSSDDASEASSDTLVEIGGLEPPTSCMPCRRSPS